jgi:hypothetical protein
VIAQPLFFLSGQPDSPLLGRHAPHLVAHIIRHQQITPCLSITTPTGRPIAFSSALRKPVSTSIGAPLGLPPANGTKDHFVTAVGFAIPRAMLADKRPFGEVWQLAAIGKAQPQ